MAGENFQSWLKAWKRKGWLARISKPVDPRYVLGAITKKLGREKGVFFEKVSGYSVPLVTNLVFSRSALATSMGIEEKDLIPSLRRAMEKPHPCEIVESAPFKEKIIKKNLNPLKAFPIPTYHERDAGPYITGGVLIAKDPETGTRNASIHRIRVFEDGLMSLLILPRHLDLCLQKCIQRKQPLEVAVAIGVDPFTLLASQAILPFGVDELEVANAMRPSSRLKLARCTTVDVEVPADSEIVLEGIIDPSQTRVEGPFGEFPRYYSPQADRPTFRLTAICCRKNPLFYSILPAGREHLLLGAIPATAMEPAKIRLATFRLGSSWYIYGALMADLLRAGLPKDSTVDVLPHAGGIGNPKLIQSGEAELGMAFNVTAKWAIEGRIGYDKKMPNLRGLVGGLDEYFVGIVATLPVWPKPWRNECPFI